MATKKAAAKKAELHPDVEVSADWTAEEADYNQRMFPAVEEPAEEGDDA